ncbi:MAG: hemH [Gammaproteobacteria bacterium]|jgi:ferrochelatase|nr:hemH [Gammaproteobacteria bacterium]
MTTLVLLINLGTPDAPTTKSVRKYLAEFLSDPRVVELPKLIWLPILHGIILNTRPKKSAKLYQKIWTAEGSPLMVNTKKIAEKLNQTSSRHRLDFAMRYGSSSIASVLKKHQGVEEIVVLPLYPQYASSATGSSLEAVMQEIKSWRHIPNIKLISNYHDHPLYIEALAKSILTHWQQHGQAQKLVLSYHGIPQRSVDLGDPYFEQCQKTTQLLTEKLGLAENQYQMVFQSRFGAAKWLQPYCSEMLTQLPKQGIKDINIICPGFSSDCLETLEEIAIQNREIFLAAGGENYRYIPCLNDSQEQIHLLLDLIKCAN